MFSLEDSGAHSLVLENGLVDGEVSLTGKSDRGFRSHGLQTSSRWVLHVHACCDGGSDSM